MDATNPCPRLMQQTLETALMDTPVVFLLGARQVGKTTLALTGQKNRTYYSFDDPSLVTLVQADPMGFVASLPNKVTLDEVQRVPELLPAIKHSVDANRLPGRFLLTGSANLLLLPKVQESLAGRMEVIHLHSLTESEKAGHTNDTLIQRWLNQGLKTNLGQPQDSLDIASRLLQGGYPEVMQRTPQATKRWFRNYIKAIIERDVQDVARIHDADQLLRLLEVLALRTGNLLNTSKLATDLGMDRETVERYLSVLERLFLLRRLPAWHRNQSKRLIKAPKIHVCDTGLACYLTGLRNTDWQTQRGLFGGILESFVLHQIMAQADALDEDVRYAHYRDKDQVEVDVVLTIGRDIYGVEIKSAGLVKPSDERGLARLASQAGQAFKGGILLYSGSNTMPLKTRDCFAVPIHAFWQGI